MQKLLSKTRQAINDFDMIQENDKVAIGLSGVLLTFCILYIFHYILFSLTMSVYNYFVIV